MVKHRFWGDVFFTCGGVCAQEDRSHIFYTSSLFLR